MEGKNTDIYNQNLVINPCPNITCSPYNGCVVRTLRLIANLLDHLKIHAIYIITVSKRIVFSTIICIIYSIQTHIFKIITWNPIGMRAIIRECYRWDHLTFNL